MKKRLTGIFTILCLGAFLFTGCGEPEEEPVPVAEAEPVTQIVWDEEPEEDVIDLSAEEASSEEVPEGMIISPLSGEYINEELENKRPLAVMFGNTTEALPQYGLSHADILYEIPVEGGITRLMAIFQDYSGLDRIGCVRSARLYFAEIATEYDAMYCHFGQAPYAESYLNSGAVTDLNGLSGTVGNIAFYRSSDKKAPHNAYVSDTGINESVEKMEYRTDYKEDFTQHFLFSGEDYSMKNAVTPSDVSVLVTGYNLSNTRFEYHPEDSLYYRFHYKREHIDGIDDSQLTFSNVIIMFMNGKVIDKNGYLEFYTVGDGTGLYLCDGKMTDVTWSKASLTDRSIFYDGNGKELVLKPGKTAICVIDTDNMDRVKSYATLEDYTNA